MTLPRGGNSSSGLARLVVESGRRFEPRPNTSLESMACEESHGFSQGTSRCLGTSTSTGRLKIGALRVQP